MSWANAKDSGVAYWAGAYGGGGGQKLSITPTSNITIPQSTSTGPVLALSPNGNAVVIPVGDWYKYVTLNGEVYFQDPVTSNVIKLHSEDDNLYWDDVLVATHDNISSIADWSLFPALSNIEVDGYNIKNVSSIYADHAFVSTADIKLGTAVSLQVSTISFISASGTFLGASNISGGVSRFKQEFTSSLNTSSIQIVSADFPGFGTLQTSLGGTELLFNGAAVRTASNTGDISQWSRYPILTGSNVAASGNNQSIFGNGNGSVLLNSGGVIQQNAQFAINLSNDRGASLLGSADINLYTKNGTYGKIALTADSGYPIDPLTDAGGLITLVANSATTGTTPVALSRVNAEAATITMSAGALGALAYVPGSVNLLSGLGTGIQILTLSGVINVASGQAMTLSAAQAIAINGGANGVRFTNDSGSKLQTDFVNTYQSNYTSIQAIDNSNMSQPTLDYIASTINSSGVSTSVQNWALYPAVSSVDFALNDVNRVKNLTANYIYSQGNIDAIGTVSAFSGTFSAINGAGPSLSITNSGYIALSTSNAVWINKSPSVGSAGDGDLHTGTLACSAGAVVGGNISCSNAVVGQIGAFPVIDSLLAISSVSQGYIKDNGNADWLILNSFSTQHIYSQVSIETDGAVLAPQVLASNVDLLSLNGVPINSPIFANPSYSTITVKQDAFMSTVQATGRIVTSATGFIASGNYITAVSSITAGTTVNGTILNASQLVRAPTVSTTTVQTSNITATGAITANSAVVRQCGVSSLTVSTINGLPYPATVYNASFSCSYTVSTTGANVIKGVPYDTTNVNNGGFTYSGSTITVPVSGTYEIIPSIQFDKTGGGTNSAFFWLKVNGSNVPDSSTEITIAGPTAATVGTASLMVSMNANDKMEVVFASSDTTMIALAVAAQTSPYSRPGNPSIITTIKRLS